MTVNRAQLLPTVQELLPTLEATFKTLYEASHPNWYAHVSFERRAQMEYSMNPRGQNVKDSESMGVMLRIFDGISMYEVCVDQLGLDELKKRALELVNKVKTLGQAAPSNKVYLSPSWSERLKAPLEKEISTQIPSGASPNTWVHFGTPLKKPLFTTSTAAMSFLKEKTEQLLKVGESLPETEPARHPDFWSGSMRVADLNFVFIDESVRMTQALKRNAVFVTVIKGEDRGFFGRGGLGGLETIELSDRHCMSAYDDLAKSLRAERLKPGKYKVLMSPAISGVFAHEAFGHSQEGDTWARGRSKARELHQAQVKVGNDKATILNNPAVYMNGEDDFAAWGSYYFDEEGWLAEKHYLVKEGWLQTPMTNLTSALRLNVPRTANGKRESWTNGMYTRQTNTYFSAGTSTFADLLEKVDYGFLATTCFGGMEDPKGMGIQVGMGFLEEIKDGKLTGRTFKGPNGGAVQMTGYVPDYLNSIIDKSKIEAFHGEKDKSTEPWNDVGGCGKYHKEYVVAGCGGPYMLVDEVHLG